MFVLNAHLFHSNWNWVGLEYFSERRKILSCMLVTFFFSSFQNTWERFLSGANRPCPAGWQCAVWRETRAVSEKKKKKKKNANEIPSPSRWFIPLNLSAIPLHTQNTQYYMYPEKIEKEKDRKKEEEKECNCFYSVQKRRCKKGVNWRKDYSKVGDKRKRKKKKHVAPSIAAL